MGWLRKQGRKIKNKVKKFFKTKLGKAIGLIGLGFVLPQAWAWLTKSTMPKWGSWYGIGGPKGFFGTGLGKASGASSSVVNISPEKLVSESNVLNPEFSSVSASSSSGDAISREIINTTNTQVAGGSNSVYPDVSSAVEGSIENTYSDISLDKLKEPGYNIKTDSIMTKPKGVDLRQDLTKEQWIDKSASIAQEEASKDAFTDVLVDKEGIFRPDSTVEVQKAADSASQKLLEKSQGRGGFKRFMTDVGVGSTTAVLTNALLGNPEQDQSVALGVQGPPQTTGPSGAFIQDISQNYVSNGEQPLNFSQYYNIDFPMYGPSAMRNVVANNQISLS